MHLFAGKIADMGLTRRELSCLHETSSFLSQFRCCQCPVVAAAVDVLVHLCLDHSLISEIIE